MPTADFTVSALGSTNGTTVQYSVFGGQCVDGGLHDAVARDADGPWYDRGADRERQTWPKERDVPRDAVESASSQPVARSLWNSGRQRERRRSGENDKLTAEVG